MSDVLVDQAKDLREKCTQCGGRMFRVTLEPEVYIIDLKEGSAEPTWDHCYRSIIGMICTSCGRKVRT